MSEHSLTMASKATSDELPEDERAEFAREVEKQFTNNGQGVYTYKVAPDVTAFVDHGERLTTEFNSPDVSQALVSLALSKGWNNYVTKGDDAFYTNIETATNKVVAERKENTLTPDQVADTVASDEEQLRRLAALRAIHDQYRVAGDRLYFKDARSSNTLAFRDTGDKLTTGLNTERVTRSMVAMAAAKGWQRIDVTGHEDFRRQVWREAQEHDIEVRGYTPTPDELAIAGKPADENNIVNALAAERAVASEGKAKQNEPASRDHSGVLLDHGAAPYQHDKDASASYYATVQTDSGERTTWGVDLERAIDDSGATLGQRVDLAYKGRQPVTVTTRVKDTDGKLVNKPIETVRNTWQVQADIVKAVGQAVAVDRIADVASREKVINAINQRVDERQSNLPTVPIYDQDAPTLEQQSPVRKMRQTAKELSR